MAIPLRGVDLSFFVLCLYDLFCFLKNFGLITSILLVSTCLFPRFSCVMNQYLFFTAIATIMMEIRLAAKYLELSMLITSSTVR